MPVLRVKNLERSRLAGRRAGGKPFAYRDRRGTRACPGLFWPRNRLVSMPQRLTPCSLSVLIVAQYGQFRSVHVDTQHSLKTGRGGSPFARRLAHFEMSFDIMFLSETSSQLVLPGHAARTLALNQSAKKMYRPEAVFSRPD